MSDYTSLLLIKSVCPVLPRRGHLRFVNMETVMKHLLEPTRYTHVKGEGASECFTATFDEIMKLVLQCLTEM